MKHATACLLILTLVIPAEAREQTPLEETKKIPLGSGVVVTLKDKQVFTGRLGELTQDGFTLWPSVAGGVSRELLFQDVRNIARVKERSAAHKVAVNILLVVSLPLLLLDCAFIENCLSWGP